MDKLTEKYLARMLEGAENGLSQMATALEQVNGQLEQMEVQREEMTTAVDELKELLGLSEEESIFAGGEKEASAQDNLSLVEDVDNN